MKITNIWVVLLSAVAISVQLCATQPEQEDQRPSLGYIQQEIAVLDKLAAAVSKVRFASNRRSCLSAIKEANKIIDKLDKKAQDALSDDMQSVFNRTSANS